VAELCCPYACGPPLGITVELFSIHPEYWLQTLVAVDQVNSAASAVDAFDAAPNAAAGLFLIRLPHHTLNSSLQESIEVEIARSKGKHGPPMGWPRTGDVKFDGGLQPWGSHWCAQWG
jgi:hypothetical protein